MISACHASQQMDLTSVGSSQAAPDHVASIKNRIASCSRHDCCHRHVLASFMRQRPHRPVWVLGKNPEVQCCLSLAAVGHPL